ncbi:MAG: molybdopterin-dependent oxidoreductase [Anaerolineales bacterium]|nr:molybdopterin-dependent oxidoreductase [Anaerolineales bacterium]
MGKLSRRDFLKLSGLGAAASAARLGFGRLPGLPGASRTLSAVAGVDASLATTCAACPRGCGLIVHTSAGRILQIEGNPAHPLNRGAVCRRGQAALQGLLSPQRLQGPLGRDGAGTRFRPMGWQAAVAVIARALQHYQPDEIVFLLGLFPDHLYDLVRRLARGLGGAQVLRCGAEGDHVGYVTLMDAAQKLFGAARAPYFDLERAEVVFSFGADFSERWLSPAVDPSAGGAQRRAYRVQFEPRASRAAALADEWLHVEPGKAALLAGALALFDPSGDSGAARAGHASERLVRAAEACGLPVSQLERLARRFFQPPGALAVPGRQVLAQPNGLQAAEAILALNARAGNLGRAGGLYLAAGPPLPVDFSRRPSAMAEIEALIGRMQAGRVKALFVHGANPLRDLPEAYALRAALQNVELLVSFSPCLDETAAEADYIFPDHAPLESWGYQAVGAGCDRPALSALQPATPPLYATRATADVLLAAAQSSGGALAAHMAYRDELDFIQQSLAGLADQGGVYGAADFAELWPLWQAHGGWWKREPCLMPLAPIGPVAAALELELGRTSLQGGAGLRLSLFEDDGAIHPGLRSDPGSTGESGAALWVEISPETARRAGVGSGERVRVISPAGEAQALVSVVAGMVPGVVAMPALEGRSASGDWLEVQRARPLDLLGKQQNESGELVLGGAPVRIEPVL